MKANAPMRNRYVGMALVLLLSATAGWMHPYWLPQARQIWSQWYAAAGGNPPAGDGEHAHEHGAGAGHSIELSPNGLKNIGYEPLTVALKPFERTVTLPAMVVERPGRSQLRVTAPLTGVVTRIVPIQGAAIEPGSPLFEVRLTHEELVIAQRDFLKSAESLDVVSREISRLKSVSDGVVAGKRIIEQEYEQQKLQGSLKAERQALLLHGLSNAQVDEIQRTRTLLQSLTVYAPAHEDHSESCASNHLFHVQELPVKVGEQVEAGQIMCVLADHCELHIEGRAFEDDALRLREALRQGWNISARLLLRGDEEGVIKGLKLYYLADHIDPKTRAFNFYLRLPNEVVLNQEDGAGHRFIDWRFKPGQRMELYLPVERWENRIVLPVDAVVEEGGEAYAYRQNGTHFDRVPIHVEYRDQSHVVVVNDGSLFPGEIVAARGAYQMHLALKNKSGGAIDPHAGHNH